MALFTSTVESVGLTGGASYSNSVEIAAGQGATVSQSGQTITLALTAPGSASYLSKVVASDVSCDANSAASSGKNLLTGFTTTNGFFYYFYGFLALSATTATPDINIKIQAVTGSITDVDINFVQYQGTAIRYDNTTSDNTFSSLIDCPTTQVAVQVVGFFRCTGSGSVSVLIKQNTSNAATTPTVLGKSFIYSYGFDPSLQNSIIDDGWKLEVM